MVDAPAGYLLWPPTVLGFLSSDSPHAATRGCLGCDQKGIRGVTEQREAQGLEERTRIPRASPWVSLIARAHCSVVDRRAAVNFTELCFKQRNFLHQSLMADSQLADLNIV